MNKLPKELLLSSPYTEVSLANINDVDQINYIKNLRNISEPVDLYCVDCKAESIFKLPRSSSISEREIRDSEFTVELQCSRNSGHVVSFFFVLRESLLVKAGQYPSAASMFQDEIKEYRKILGEEKQKELSRALGLYSHGVGIGSFVYMRRIFEYLIEEAHLVSKEHPDWNEDVYIKSHVSEKIDILKNNLPVFIVENKSLYSILSLGIHELAEQDCLSYFDVVKASVFIILDEKLEELKKKENTKKARAAISIVNEHLAKNAKKR